MKNMQSYTGKTFLHGRTGVQVLAGLTVGVLFLLAPQGAYAQAPSGSSGSAVTVRTQRPSYAVGEEIVVEYSGLPGNKTDWITIVKAGAPDGDWTSLWFYTDGKRVGSHTFAGGVSEAGSYEARVHFNYPDGGKTVYARYSFTVGSSTPPGGGGGDRGTGGNFVGEWNTDWGKMRIVQEGNRLRGYYGLDVTINNGVRVEIWVGTLEEITVRGNVMEGKWVELWDWGYFRFTLADSRSFVGDWWYSDQSYGDTWSGNR